MKTRTQKLSRALRWAAGLIGCLALASLSLGACFGAPGYQGPRSAHFDGERFINQVPQPNKGLTDYVSMRFGTDKVTWPETLANQPQTPPVQRVGQGQLRITVVGHSTVLIQVDGLNILTDPVWSDSIGPVSWAGKERARPPALALDDLPPIDAILISHNHYDHLDIPTLRALHTRFHPIIFAGLGTRRLLAEHDIEGSVDLDWWQTRRLRTTSAHITAVPAQHWSGEDSAIKKTPCGWASSSNLTTPGSISRATQAGDRTLNKSQTSTATYALHFCLSGPTTRLVYAQQPHLSSRGIQATQNPGRAHQRPRALWDL